jgi:hypothetical protein
MVRPRRPFLAGLCHDRIGPLGFGFDGLDHMVLGFRVLR